MPQSFHLRFVLIFAFVATALLPIGLSAQPETPPRLPNIIFIMADDLGYADLGCYGQKLIQTPRIDQMAREGLRFTSCYSGHPVCAPSRCVLMTGLHTGHCRVRGNSPIVGGQRESFGDEGARRLSMLNTDRFVSEALKQAGYRTGITGKWGLAEPGTDGVPTRQGFDEWLGYLNQNHAPHFFTDFLWRNEEKMPIPENSGGVRKVYSHDLMTDFCLEFINDNKNQPFFLYVPYTIPHRLWEVPDLSEYADRDWPESAKIYAAMVTRMDRDVGRILDLLDKLDLSKDTYVFFTSDNGVEKKADQPWQFLFESQGPFRGWKGDLYEGGLRVPMVVRRPSVVPAGAASDVPWYFADFFPTCCDLAGVEPPQGLDGVSVAPAFTNESLTYADDRFFYWEYAQRDFQQAVRWKHWKMVREAPGGQVELYDLSKDIGETNDLSREYPIIVQEMASRMDSAHEDSEHWPFDPKSVEGP